MRHIRHILIIVLALVMQACETDIPEIDNTPPEFTFRIIGDGLEYVFDKDDDYDNIQFNLKNGAKYDFIYTGSDDGGVELIRWQLPISDYIEFDSSIPAPWQDNVTGLSRTIQWNGDSSNPLTGFILSGTFEANGELVSDTFRFFVSDFGGETGDTNTVSKQLNILIGNQDTEIVELQN